MTEPVDSAARARAIEPRRSVIVQAPAGSGKTSLLVKRFLVLLGQVEAPEQILAITFTRKATAEMRKRVLNALRGKKEDGSSEDDPELLSLGQLARANDQKYDWQLLQHIQRIRIQTIDSFCSELVRRMPWSARFGAPPTLLEDASDLYQQAASLTLDLIEDQRDPAIAEACAALIHLLDSNRQSTADLLAAMLRNRDQWMPSVAQFDRMHVEGWWQQTIGQALEHCYRMLSPGSRSELARLAKYAAVNLANLRADTPNHAESPVDLCLVLEKFPEPRWQEVASWRGIAAVLLTSALTPRSRVDKRQGFPANNSEQKAQKVSLSHLTDELKENPALALAWKRVAQLPNGEFSEEQWRVTAALLKLLPLAAGQLRVLFNQRNEADYTELAQRADLALGHGDQPSDLALALDYRLQHLLMDEFQDTSSGQVELLKKLLEGWTGDDGRSAFFVGDPMQSIYGFRQADVANFLNTQDHGIGNLQPEPMVLECNFRSAPNLVDWFNTVFKMVMPAERDIIHGAVDYTSAIAFKSAVTGSIAEVHAAVDRDSGAEAVVIADLIHSTLKSFESDKVAVLGRTRKNLEALVAELERRGMPYQGVKLQKLVERQSIQDLLALTLALLDPADRTSWLGLLRGPWLGATLDELSLLCEGKKSQTILSLLEDEQCLAGISPERRQLFNRVTAIMQQGMLQRSELPLHNNLEACWLRLGGPAMVEQVDLANCRRFIQLVEKLSAQPKPINQQSLAKAMSDLYADSGSDARVQLLTIHAAKGLEFDTVILPDLQRPPRSSDSTLLRWKPFPDRTLIAPRASSQENGNQHFDFIGELNKDHLHNELSRLLYVACTRARKRLHLFASAGAGDDKGTPILKPPPANSLLGILWPAVKPLFNEALDNQVGSGQQIPADAFGDTVADEAPLIQCPPGWHLPAINPGVEFKGSIATTNVVEQVEYDWAQNIARVVGIVIHQTLQEVENVGWDNWLTTPFDNKQRQLWRNRLIRHGITGNELDQAARQVESALENTRTDPAAAWIFSSDHSEVRTEWPLTGVVDGAVRHVILDRSFVDSDSVRWIVDFKSSRHDSRANVEQFLDQEKNRYRDTMANYATILSNLVEQPVKAALYYPVLQQLVEL